MAYLNFFSPVDYLQLDLWFNWLFGPLPCELICANAPPSLRDTVIIPIKRGHLVYFCFGSSYRLLVLIFS